MRNSSASDDLAAYDRTAVYDALYSRGYQLTHNSSYSQSGWLIPTLRELQRNDSRLRTALDLGCSHGLATTQLWDLGLRASGVDISNVAIAAARRIRGGDVDKQCVPPIPDSPLSCFQQGSVINLPWPDDAFDVTMSSDVLEHLPPQIVGRAVAELSRVTRRYLLLKVSVRHEGMTSAYKQLAAEVAHNQTHVKLPKALHETVQHSDYWIQKFAAGWALHSRIEVPAHACCAFVLRRGRG